MSIGQTYKYKTQRKKLTADINAFLETGGTIEHLPFGIRKDDRVSYNNHSKTKPPKK